MKNNEINGTEEVKDTVEGVTSASSKAGAWVIGGIIMAVTATATLLGIRHHKKKKAAKAAAEREAGDDWADDLDETVRQIKNEDID